MLGFKNAKQRSQQQEQQRVQFHGPGFAADKNAKVGLRKASHNRLQSCLYCRSSPASIGLSWAKGRLQCAIVMDNNHMWARWWKGGTPIQNYQKILSYVDEGGHFCLGIIYI